MRSSTLSSIAISCPSTVAHSVSNFAFIYGLNASVVSCKMPRRASPSAISSAHIAAPLSLKPRRGNPRRRIACDSPWATFSAVLCRYHCR